MHPVEIFPKSLKSEITVTSLAQKERSISSSAADNPNRSTAALNCSSSYRSKLSNCFPSQSSSSTFAGHSDQSRAVWCVNIVNPAVLHSGIADLAFFQRQNCLFILIFGNRERDRDRREMCADPVFERCFKHVFHLVFNFLHIREGTLAIAAPANQSQAHIRTRPRADTSCTVSLAADLDAAAAAARGNAAANILLDCVS